MTTKRTTPEPVEPGRDCPLCPRLAAFRQEARERAPDWFNAPVPAFGDAEGRLLIVGLAPGLRGVNRTGRPFTGDYAGDLLYETLAATGFSSGRYEARPDDGLALVDCRIVNAVRCVPPQNKPLPGEIAQCRPFLVSSIAAMARLRVIVALGRIAHEGFCALSACGSRRSRSPTARRISSRDPAGRWRYSTAITAPVTTPTRAFSRLRCSGRSSTPSARPAMNSTHRSETRHRGRRI